MTMQRSTFTSPVDGLELAGYAWDVADPRGVVQVAHGLAEHSARYDRFARALNEAGYAVRASDHRGHGASIAGTPGDFGDPGFDGLIADLAAYGESLRGDLPLFLFAHSMGSFAAQSVLLTHSEQYAGVVLSGSTALDLLAAGMAEAEGPAGLEAFNAGLRAPHRLRVALPRRGRGRPLRRRPAVRLRPAGRDGAGALRCRGRRSPTRPCSPASAPTCRC